MLAVRHDKALADSIERIVSIIRAASYTTDGFISTYVLNDMPDKRWGENGGNIVIQHDLYNHGALIEAAVSHYRATGETTLLDCAVRAATSSAMTSDTRRRRISSRVTRCRKKLLSGYITSSRKQGRSTITRRK